MIFFVAMPFVIGLMNFVLPLQLGVRDVAFPVLNSVGFWLTAAGVLLVNVSLVVGEFARTGWLAYPPLSEVAYSPGVGVDHYLWSLQISGMGTLLSGINLTTTILKLRAPGMGYRQMPIFCWTALASNLLIVAAFPILTATFAMLLLDRYCGFHFFTNDLGGNPDDVHQSHLELGTSGGIHLDSARVRSVLGGGRDIFGQVLIRPPLDGDGNDGDLRAVLPGVAASFFHHGRRRGCERLLRRHDDAYRGADGCEHFHWLFTLYGGRIRFTAPIYWAIGFMVTFVIGGMTGVLMAIPPADFVLHNSLFLIAHFHNVVIGGVVFGVMAGITYWFPKAFGFTLNERLGKAVFWCWFFGFYLAFMPLYVLGLMGATRRMQHYSNTHWQPLMLVALAGALLILLGIALTGVQLAVSIHQRECNRDVTGDPWNGRTLEWSTPSPPPAWNFANLPQVDAQTHSGP